MGDNDNNVILPVRKKTTTKMGESIGNPLRKKKETKDKEVWDKEMLLCHYDEQSRCLLKGGLVHIMGEMKNER